MIYEPHWANLAVSFVLAHAASARIQVVSFQNCSLLPILLQLDRRRCQLEHKSMTAYLVYSRFLPNCTPTVTHIPPAPAPP